MNQIKLLPKVGLLLVFIGCLFPVYLNTNASGLSNYIQQRDFFQTFMTWFLVSTMFWATVGGLIVGIIQMFGKLTNPKYDIIAVILCVGSGLILLLGVNLTLYLAVATLFLYLANKARHNFLKAPAIFIFGLFYIFAVMQIFGDIALYKTYGIYNYFHSGAIIILFGWLVSIVGLIKRETTIPNQTNVKPIAEKTAEST